MYCCNIAQLELEITSISKTYVQYCKSKYSAIQKEQEAKARGIRCPVWTTCAKARSRSQHRLRCCALAASGRLPLPDVRCLSMSSPRAVRRSRCADAASRTQKSSRRHRLRLRRVERPTCCCSSCAPAPLSPRGCAPMSRQKRRQRNAIRAQLNSCRTRRPLWTTRLRSRSDSGSAAWCRCSCRRSRRPRRVSTRPNRPRPPGRSNPRLHPFPLAPAGDVRVSGGHRHRTPPRLNPESLDALYSNARRAKQQSPRTRPRPPAAVPSSVERSYCRDACDQSEVRFAPRRPQQRLKQKKLVSRLRSIWQPLSSVLKPEIRVKCFSKQITRKIYK